MKKSKLNLAGSCFIAIFWNIAYVNVNVFFNN